MKTSKYIKEKLYFIILGIIISIVFEMFFLITKVQTEIVIVVQLLLWFLILTNLVVEYMRRASFYNNLNEALNDLDKKYLISEIIEEPEFMDGQIFYDSLSIIDKSMNDHVSFYRNAQEEYKEYIELWVHEIKTPLAASKLILTNNNSEASQSLEEEIDKVEGYVDQALFYARSNTLQKDYMIKKMSLKTSINQVIRKHSKTFILRNIKIELNNLKGEVYSDSKWVEFILDQIINNALKYSKDNETIEISALSNKENVVLSIKDHGCGIRKQDLPRVFEKGFTGNNGRTHEKATGMGLYLCKKLCDKLYLGIDVTSDEEGTNVFITFPMSNHNLIK
ncbi:MAG: sensor histidine kinase [Erysipelotrichaceae bacterium]